MIIVKIQGGLGNQLFQYSLGRSLSKRTGLPIKLDISSFLKDPLRKLELSSFKAEWERATALESSRLKYGLANHILSRTIGRTPQYRSTYIKEKSHRFDPFILDVKGNAYLDGYWQSEKYFREVDADLQKELIPKTNMPAQLEQLAARIRSCESISVHVRRGDYITNPINREIFHVCEIDYFKNSAAFLVSRLTQPRFFVFGEDVSWVREVLLPVLGNSAEFVPPENPIHDLYLMSCCRHHIIANSSYSWWGAWLNPGKNKIVMAPRRWFKRADQDSADLVPESWNRKF